MIPHPDRQKGGAPLLGAKGPGQCGDRNSTPVTPTKTDITKENHHG